MSSRAFLVSIALLGLLVPGKPPVIAAQSRPASPAAPASVPERAQVPQALRSSPIMFIENVGQFADGARFQVRGGSGTMWLAEDAIWITVAERSHVDTLERFDVARASVEREDEPLPGVNLKLSFPSADPHPRLEPFDRLDTVVSFFIGDDSDEWHTDVPVWGGVRYVDLYPGMDLVVGASAPRRPQGTLLPWRLEVRDGADLSAVRLHVDGADGLALDDAGYLRLTTAVGEFTLPLLTVEGATPDGQPATFNVERGTFDLTSPFSSAPPLPSSPAQTAGRSDLLYSTFLGGSDLDWGEAIAVDAAGSTYMAGRTRSSDFPTTAGAFDTSFNGGSDAFVVKLNAGGTRLAYATFLGGSGDDEGYAIAVDGVGSAYVTGRTFSSDFPTTAGAFDMSFNGGELDSFVVKVNASGTGLAYATFLGGSGYDESYAIAVDRAGNAYVAGRTYSSNFPTTVGAFDTSLDGWQDAFVVKLNAIGTRLVYATLLGGSDSDQGNAIAVDRAGSAYVTGVTQSSDFPTTAVAFDTSYNGGYGDAFVVRMNGAGTGLAYATFLGGSDRDWGYAIAVDESGNAYVAGTTSSFDFPTTAGAFDTSYNGGYYDTFVVKLNAIGTRLVYATFLGGSDWDWGEAIAVDRAGSAYVTGFTQSSDFPTTAGAFDTSYDGGSDAFVVKVNAGGTGLTYATFLGGSRGDLGFAIAVDGAGSAYVTGFTQSSDFPTTAGVFDTSYNGDYDAFVVKLAVCDPEQPDICFRPSRDGYSFSNSDDGWGSFPWSAHDFRHEDLVRMFDQDAVCRMVGPVCFVKWAADLWHTQVNWYMNGGHCDGFTTTSLRFFKDLDNPADVQTGANTTHDLHLDNSRQHIAYYWVLQVPNPVAAARNQALQKPPSQVLDQLRYAMSGGAPDPTTLIVYNTARTAGHSITPYAIEDQGDGVYWVRVYDNNHPNDANRYVVINPTNDTWSYNLGWTTWSGDANSHSLGAIPISTYAQQPECPWCDGPGTLSGSPSGQVWLTGEGHLLITDSQGRRIGYVGDQFVNEVPGAFGSVPPGGLGTPAEPIYTLPLADTYTILLDGQTLAQTETVEVTQFGPGYAVWVDDVTLGPASQDWLTIASDGTQVAYQSSSDKEATLTLALDGADESNQLQINGADIGAGQAVTLTADVGNGQLVFSNAQASGGEYNLEVRRVSAAGEQIFVHTGLVISATDTHYADYGAWDGSGPMTLHVDHDSDGTIDETLELDNQAWRIYLPLILRNR